ncbi:Y-family DNA polymerase [Rhodobium orientis]|uniref:Y-family DNA polymerase n=1 Tax=Rhodobium orientis TaxID=34017 RepID=UPI001FD1102A|nr:DNA polymerase Y family protein [Rhodobium orientis]
MWFPYLSADRIQRRSRQNAPAPAREKGAPLVFIEKDRSALRLAAGDARAEKLGLCPGLALADARARIPELEAVEMDRAADAAFLERIADFCDRYTPLVALDPPDGLILDITGCAHLLNGEDRLHADIKKRLAALGITVRASIAGTPEAAKALARFGRERIVPAGGEPDAVAPLPAAALDLAPQTVQALSRAGLKTVGALAERPRPPLAARFGADLVARLAGVLGERDLRITPRRPMPPTMAERSFAEPIGLEADMLEALRSLASHVCGSLETRGEGGRSFEAAFFRTDGRVFRIGIETVEPQRDPAVLIRLFRERLGALPDPLDPGFGFDFIRLAVIASEPAAMPQTSLDGSEAAEQEVSDLIDRLIARFGRDAVRRFVAVDSHIPELAARTVPALGAAEDGTPWIPPEAQSRPIHLFDPPQPIETLAEVPDGPPLRFRWRRAMHDIARAEGPERIAAEWWRADGLTRDYYRVEDGAGRRYWVFREGLYGLEAERPRWFLHGIFP